MAEKWTKEFQTIDRSQKVRYARNERQKPWLNAYIDAEVTVLKVGEGRSRESVRSIRGTIIIKRLQWCRHSIVFAGLYFTEFEFRLRCAVSGG